MVHGGDADAPHALLWIAMITSARTAPWPGDIAIAESPGAGPTRASLIRPAKIASLDAARVRWVAGRVGEQEVAARLDWIRARLSL